MTEGKFGIDDIVGSEAREKWSKKIWNQQTKHMVVGKRSIIEATFFLGQPKGRRGRGEP